MQFSGQDITSDTSADPDATHAYCAGTTRYSYLLNRELGHDSDNGADTDHVLWRDTMNSSALPCAPINLLDGGDPAAGPNTVPGSGYEMMAEHMRITRLFARENPPGSDAHEIDLWTAYGDSDLVVNGADGKTRCRGGEGTQFCAVAHIDTTVLRRAE